LHKSAEEAPKYLLRHSIDLGNALPFMSSSARVKRQMSTPKT